MPDEEYDDRAHDRAEKAGALVWAVPADGLADKRGDECAGDAEERCENKARRIVWAGARKRAMTPATKPIMMIQRTCMTNSVRGN